MSGRLEFSPKTKTEAFRLANGRCRHCLVKLSVGNVRYDHHVAAKLGGDNSLSNCQVLCRNCHDQKTAKVDVPAIAKTKRVHRKNIGAGSGRKQKVGGWLSTKFRRKVDGTVEER